jgi:hypothetical protein
MASFTLDREISVIKTIPYIGPYVANGMQRIQDAVNSLSTSLAADPNGKMTPPPPIDGVNVKAADGAVHVTITDHNPIQRGIQYFVEHSTDPTFIGAHVIHLNASRGGVLTIPGMTDEGADQPVYIRAYSQYRTSVPSKPVNFGGTTPTAVLPGGNVMMTLLPSTGSGTAISNGQQQGSGLGKVLYRPPVAPKRTGG